MDEDEGVPLSRGFPIKEVRWDKQGEGWAMDQKSIASSRESLTGFPRLTSRSNGNIRRFVASFSFLRFGQQTGVEHAAMLAAAVARLVL